MMKLQTMLRMCTALVAALLVSSVARAEEAKALAAAQASGSAVSAPAEEAAAAAPEAVDPGMLAVVRGFYMEGRVGGGYMLKNAELADLAAYPNAKEHDKTEALGAGALVHLAIGYDITDAFAIQLLGGTTQVSTTRSDYVRDVSFAFAGLGARGAIDLSDRLDLLLSGGVAYVSADNQVETAKTGIAVLGGVGVEYYVHVRHFSVGVELQVFAPLSPTRVFVSVAPQIKYTFF